MEPPALSVYPLRHLPEVRQGDDLAALIANAAGRAGWCWMPGDVLAVAQKIVSKAEGRLVPLREIQPSAAAFEMASRADKDPRIVELILRESRSILRVTRGVIIAEHRSGVILANAGIDRSNTGVDEESVLLLPEDADASAARIRAGLASAHELAPAILVTDSIGRPWRLGTTGVAIGCAGLPALVDLRGQPDRAGRALQVSEIALADSLAATAVLTMGEGAESTPAALLRGMRLPAGSSTALALLRAPGEDLFR